jgi:hypothetical protein
MINLYSSKKNRGFLSIIPPRRALIASQATKPALANLSIAASSQVCAIV